MLGVSNQSVSQDISKPEIRHQCQKGNGHSVKFAASKTLEKPSEAAAAKPTSGIAEQMPKLQKMVSQTLSDINLARDIASPKFGGADKTGFNSNDIGSQIKRIVTTIDSMISDITASAGGTKSCSAAGNMEQMNQDLKVANDKVMDAPLQMTSDLHTTLNEISNLLNELLNLMNSRGSFHSNPSNH